MRLVESTCARLAVRAALRRLTFFGRGRNLNRPLVVSGAIDRALSLCLAKIRVLRAERGRRGTNRFVVTGEPIDLPVGSLQASASLSARPFAFTATVVEQLEAKEPDGSDAVLVASSGDELLDDLAAVLSFRTNSLFSRDVDLVRRLLGLTNTRQLGSGDRT